MRLESIQIQNYCGVSDSGDIGIGELLLLVGPNNSGKSTILRGLDLFFNDSTFDSKLDYPMEKMDGKRGFRASTKIKVTFSKESGDRLGKRLSSYIVSRQINSERKGVIIMEVEYPRDYNEKKIRKIRINNRYRGDIVEGSKYGKVFDLVREKVAYAYIPALRLLGASDNKDELLNRLLTLVLVNSKKYRKAEKSYISSIHQQLTAVNKFLKKSTPGFPEVKDIRIEYSGRSIHNLGVGAKAMVTTGATLPVEKEGTGLQSALTIAIMRYAFHSLQKKSGGTRVVLGIEEPEIFLHPPAQRALVNNVLDKSQILVSTHSPVILDELSPKDFKGILRCRAVSEKNNAERFVRLSDKSDLSLLTQLYENSEVTGSEFFFGNIGVLVEGESDRKVLRKHLRVNNFFTATLIGVGGNTQFARPIRTLRNFGMPIVIVADGDCFDGTNSGRFQRDLVAEGLISAAEWATLKKSVLRKISKGHVFRKKFDDVPNQFAGLFVFPGALESALVSSANVDIIIHWLLEYGKKGFNFPDALVEEIKAIKILPITERVRGIQACVLDDGKLKKRYITEQLYDLLVRKAVVPEMFNDFYKLLYEIDFNEA